MITSVATIWAFCALYLVIIIVAVYFCIFAFIFYVMFYGIAKMIKSVLKIFSHG